MRTETLTDHSGKIQDFVESVDTFLFDCDGVLWHEEKIFLEGVKATLEYLVLTLKKRVLFVSNNSTTSRRSFTELCHSLGATFITPDCFFGSAFATAIYLKDIANVATDKKIFIIGEKGMSEELENVGYSVVHANEHDLKSLEADIRTEVPPPSELGAVAIGFDIHFNYHKLAHANYYLRDKKNPILFVATNTDSSYATKNGHYPGTGTIVTAVAYGCQRTPIVIGKPEPIFMDCVKNAFPMIDLKRTCMIGDRLDTDMLFGIRSGVKTCLVLTGIATLEDLDGTAEAEKPDFVISGLGNISRTLLR